MDKLEIYNKALDLCGQEPLTQEDLESEDKDQTVTSLDAWYMTALRKASKEMPWSFLEVEIQLGDDGGSGHGYLHSYKLPEDIESITWASGERYQRIGDKLFTDGEPKAYGILKDIVPDTNVPEDFYDLVAIALAYYASVRLSPDTTTRNAIYYLYQDRRDEMINYSLQSERKGTLDRNAFEDSLC